LYNYAGNGVVQESKSQNTSFILICGSDTFWYFWKCKPG